MFSKTFNFYNFVQDDRLQVQPLHHPHHKGKYNLIQLKDFSKDKDLGQSKDSDLNSFLMGVSSSRKMYFLQDFFQVDPLRQDLSGLEHSLH